jgi:hypothetical protein
MFYLMVDGRWSMVGGGNRIAGAGRWMMEVEAARPGASVACSDFRHPTSITG